MVKINEEVGVSEIPWTVLKFPSARSTEQNDRSARIEKPGFLSSLMIVGSRERPSMSADRGRDRRRDLEDRPRFHLRRIMSGARTRLRAICRTYRDRASCSEPGHHAPKSLWDSLSRVPVRPGRASRGFHFAYDTSRSGNFRPTTRIDLLSIGD